MLDDLSLPWIVVLYGCSLVLAFSAGFGLGFVVGYLRKGFL